MDTIVIDIETKNFFDSPGVGRDNFSALEISMIGAYSYAQGEYFCFDETEIEKAMDFFNNSNLIVGFSHNRYDVPVLANYFSKLEKNFDIWQKDRYDILDEIEMRTGGRISLGLLAYENLGVGKSGSGAKAIELYKEGRIDELKEYCLQDVKITKELYDLIKKQGYLMVPQRSGEPIKVDFREIF